MRMKAKIKRQNFLSEDSHRRKAAAIRYSNEDGWCCKSLNISKYIGLCLVSCAVVLQMNQSAFEIAEKVFCNSVVVRIPLS